MDELLTFGAGLRRFWHRAVKYCVARMGHALDYPVFAEPTQGHLIVIVGKDIAHQRPIAVVQIVDPMLAAPVGRFRRQLVTKILEPGVELRPTFPQPAVELQIEPIRARRRGSDLLRK